MLGLARWMLTCYAVLWLCPASGQHVPSLPRILQFVRDLARHRADGADELSGALVSLRRRGDPYGGLWTNLTESSNEKVASLCKDHLSLLAEGLIERKTWALTFVDAVGKIPSGVLEGDLLWLGGFSQCRGIKVLTASANNTEVRFRGRYCMASIGNRTGMTTPSSIVIKLGVCIPNSCNETDAYSLLDAASSYLPTDIGVLSIDCKPDEKPAFSVGAIAVMLIFSIIGALVLCGTCYDVFWHQQNLSFIRKPANDDLPVSSSSPAVMGDGDPTEQLIPSILPDRVATVQPKPGVGLQMLMCFSLTANVKKILAVDEKNPNTLTALHGIRFLSMSWVILGHSLVFQITMMKNPTVFLDDYLKRFTFQALINATVSVDTFFLLSGTLASYLLLKQINKSGGLRNINWALLYSHRFWRLTPAYMLVLGFYTTLFSYMGSGPLYPETDDAFCKKNWWHNLLYINNLFNQSEECMDWMWYLANDMQFFLISPLIIVALYNWFVVGVVIIGALITMNILAVWILTEKIHYMVDTVNTTGIMNWFSKIYVRPYCRIGVYVIGIALGYALCRLPARPRLHILWVIVGWLLAACCCLSVVYGLYGVPTGDKVLSSGVNAFYASFNRIGWAVGVAWVIFACSSGYGGPVNTLLSWSGFVPLSRLTYMAYLIHPIIITYLAASSEVPVFLCNRTIISTFIANLGLAYGFAFILSVTLESPLIALEKLLLPQKNR